MVIVAVAKWSWLQAGILMVRSSNPGGSRQPLTRFCPKITNNSNPNRLHLMKKICKRRTQKDFLKMTKESGNFYNDDHSQ